MKAKHPQIVLYQPEIPQNVGNIARLAAATASRLHLIRPLGFGLNDKNLRRAGLDYWPFLDMEIHDDEQQIFDNENCAFLTKFADRPYTEIPHETTHLVFGRETSGLPQSIHKRFGGKLFSIPMFHDGVRSLNLANAASIVVYEMLRKAQVV